MDLFTLREVEPGDLSRQYFTVLRTLTVAPTPTLEAFSERIEMMKHRDVHVFVVVDNEKDCIAGTLTVLLEPKLSRNLSFVAHVEDVAIHPDYQGKRLGQMLVQHACAFSRDRGCYKVILDASDSNGGFYEKCGFVKKETQYRYDIA